MECLYWSHFQFCLGPIPGLGRRGDLGRLEVVLQYLERLSFKGHFWYETGKARWAKKSNSRRQRRVDLCVSNRVFSRPVAWPVVTMETVGQTNQRTMTAGAQALSGHYIMLIRPLQALPLVRIYRKLLFSNIFFKWKACLHHFVAYIRKKKKIHRILLKFKSFVGTSTSWMTDTQSWPFYIGSKRGKLQACPHRPVFHPFPWRWRCLENPLLDPILCSFKGQVFPKSTKVSIHFCIWEFNL